MKTRRTKGERPTYKGVTETFAPQTAQPTPTEKTEEEIATAAQQRLTKQAARFIKRT